jgi:hypothetical protein
LKLPKDGIPDTAIWIRIHTVWWLAHEDIAIHKYSSLLESQLLSQGMASPNSYKDDKTAWDIVVILGELFRRLLKNRVRNSPYFGIMIDETTDTSTEQQLIIRIHAAIHSGASRHISMRERQFH